MANILDQIVASKRTAIDRAKATRPIDGLRRQAAAAEPPRDFYAAIQARKPNGISLIAEVKRLSPSAGMICKDYDPAEIARLYYAAGASAISVLTDEPHFDGHLDHVAIVKQAIPLPVLRKDFILEEYQIWESRAAGADCMLLIAEVLGIDAAIQLAGSCDDLQMTSLIESHRPEFFADLCAAVKRRGLRRVLLGINNRDLNTQTTDVGHTAKLLSAANPSAPIVAESGIRTRADVDAVQEAGAIAILVGEAILCAADRKAAIAELLGAPAG